MTKLAKEQSKWRRRETIARNKLMRVRYQIEELAVELLTANTPGADTVWAKRKITK